MMPDFKQIILLVTSLAGLLSQWCLGVGRRCKHFQYSVTCIAFLFQTVLVCFGGGGFHIMPSSQIWIFLSQPDFVDSLLQIHCTYFCDISLNTVFWVHTNYTPLLSTVFPSVISGLAVLLCSSEHNILISCLCCKYKNTISQPVFFFYFYLYVFSWRGKLIVCKCLSEEVVLMLVMRTVVVVMGGGFRVSPKRQLLASVACNAPSAPHDWAVSGAWEWRHLSGELAAQWRGWWSPTSQSNKPEEDALHRHQAWFIFFSALEFLPHVPAKLLGFSWVSVTREEKKLTTLTTQTWCVTY